MCGIIGVFRKDGADARKHAWKRYKSQEKRGQEGYGFVAMNGDNLLEVARSETEAAIKNVIDEVPCKSIVFHHRYPTSTPNLVEAAHPIKVSHESLTHDYYVVHNGVMWGDDVLKKKHEALGFKYTTELVCTWKTHSREFKECSKWNDSEALAIELAIDLDKKAEGIEVKGSIAFIAVEVDKVSKKVTAIYFGRNTMPLKLYNAKGLITICSEGMGKDIDTDTLYIMNPATLEITSKPYKLEKPTMGFSTKSNYSFDPETLQIGRNDISFDGEEAFDRKANAYAELDYPDEYYTLLVQFDELTRQFRILEAAGRETLIIETQLDEIEKQLQEYEFELDRSAAKQANAI